MIVDELRKSILQQAIFGNLSKYIKGDTLIDDYISIVKSNEYIKQKNVTSKFEYFYNIPENWKWVKLGEIVGIYGGKRIPAGRKLTTENTGYKYIRVADMNDITVTTDNILYVPKDIYLLIKNYTISKDDLYITVAGTIGKVGFIPKELDGANLTENANKLVFKSINKKWLYYSLTSPFVQHQIEEFTTKVGQPKLAIKRIENIEFPLPPIEEQQRIVDKIEELFAKLDEIKPIEEELRRIKNNFPNDMRKSIILSAISGKLSYQNDNEKINIQQLKSITKVVGPFTIPDNWLWLGHNDLFEVIGGSQPPKSKFSNTNCDGFVQLYQTRDYGPNPQPVFVDRKDVTKFTKKGDIILARYGGSLGKVFWAEDGAYNVALAKVVLKYPTLINIKYLYYYYLGDLYQSKVKNGNRSAQAGFSKDDLNDLPFPLPPIEEQQRIVDKLEQLLPLCDDIEKIINAKEK